MSGGKPGRKEISSTEHEYIRAHAHEGSYTIAATLDRQPHTIRQYATRHGIPVRTYPGGRGGWQQAAAAIAATTALDEPWRDQAACIDADPDIFFPPDNGTPGPLQTGYYREARTYCDRCEVRQECLNYAIANNEKYGLWGGHTPKQRQQLRRRRSA